MKSSQIKFLVIILLASLSLEAQITYTDIDPDVTSTLDETTSMASDIVSIDFNGDGTEEYNFRWDDWGPEGWFMHMTYGTNELNLKGTAENPFGGRYIDPMESGTTIDSGSNWGNSFPEPFIGDDTDPNFQDLGDRYVGCKFSLGTNTHYGWVRVSFDGNKTLTVKDYAYEATADTAINAGETGVTASIEEIDFDNYFRTFPIPAKNTLIIENIKNVQVNQIRIINLLGQNVLSKTKIDDNKIVIDVSQLKSGQYFMKLDTANDVFLKKILLR